MAGYSLEIKRSAAREMEEVEPRTQRARVVTRIRALASDPRPPGSQKLAGTDSLDRIRQGSLRILYEIDDAKRRVTVIRIAHRREAYR